MSFSNQIFSLQLQPCYYLIALRSSISTSLVIYSTPLPVFERMFTIGLLLLTAGSVLSASINDTKLPMLRIAHQERGILTFSFDPSKSSSRSLELVSTTQAGIRPGWLHWHDSLIYSVSRTNYPNNSSSSGGVFSFDKKAEDPGALSLVTSQSSNGLGGVFCDVARDGRTLSVANM